MKMWPMYVDYSDDDCKRVLRSLELEAYAAVVNVFRAQGSLTKEKKKMLNDLCSLLSISIERHRAEIRRVTNDEHLNTIADRLFGSNTLTEWAVEGRRLVPLMPRLAPQTAFTALADAAANMQASRNVSLPMPGKTGTREVNGMETMSCRKRKDFPSEYTGPPQKYSAVENQCTGGLGSFENGDLGVPVTTENSTLVDTSQVPLSFADLPLTKTTTTLVTSDVTQISPAKTIPKQMLVKSASTVTTFSSFDQLNTNLSASRSASNSALLSRTSEDQTSIASESLKTSSESRNIQRPSPSQSPLKSSVTMPIPSTSPSSSSMSSDRSSVSNSVSATQRFLSQIRSKTTRHSVPSTVGLKLPSQSPPVNQRTPSPKSSPNVKTKPENVSYFPKKSSAVFTSPSEGQTSQFVPVTTESQTVSKSPILISKQGAKSEPQTVSSTQTGPKVATITKSFQKPTVPGSQYMARSLFTPTAKPGVKGLSPVIFNVSSTSPTPSLQTASKTTASVQNEPGKTSQQLLPKSTTVGIPHSHLKLNSSNTQTIQYRNDGGVMRNARIVSISQPGGSRLPCAISPSAISALGFTSSISSTALRVTLPAGTLSSSPSIRVSAAAKPNVIVVHKAQMWPRTQHGAAVIMSSPATLPKLPTDTAEKARLSGPKLAPRPITSTRPQSPAVAPTAVKISESIPLPSRSAQASTSVASDIAAIKASENLSENQCKKNLLADVIEASGILESSSGKAGANEKNKKSSDVKETKVENQKPATVEDASSSKKSSVPKVISSSET